jgi:hypothetical protein
MRLMWSNKAIRICVPLGVLLAFIAGCSDRTGADVEGRILNCGVVTFSGEAREMEDPTMPTGKRWRVRDATFTAHTNRIPAKIGVAVHSLVELGSGK